MAVPAVYELHKRGFDIDWVCGRAARPLLECYSWINVLPVDDRAILRGRFVERARSIVGLWAKVAKRHYDLCAVLYYDRRFRWLTAPIRARRKFMLSNDIRARRLLPGRHHTDEYYRLLAQEEDVCRDSSTCPVSPDRLPPGPVFPDRNGRRRIALFPGGTSNVLGEQVLRRWPVENYAAAARLLAARGWEVVVMGGVEDTWVQPYFQHLGVRGAIGTLSLPEVVRAFDECDAVVTHDTGPLHLAGLSDCSLIAIFGPTDPATRVPRRPYSVGIWGGQGFACRPCYDGRDFAPCKFNGCMHQVTPELVLGELDRLLAERQAGLSSPWRIVFPDPTRKRPNR